MAKKYYAIKRKNRRVAHTRFYVIIGVLVAALALGIILMVIAITGQPGSSVKPSDSINSPTETATAPPTETVPPSPTPTVPPTATPAPTLAADLVPHPTKETINGKEVNTDPSAFGFQTQVKVGDDPPVTTYQRPDPITFGTGSEYTQLEGVITFRGNNYRNAPSWGTATVTDEKLTLMRQPKQTGKIATWGGFAWTGQPVVVKWPEKTRKNMTSLKQEYRDKADFTEVIIASLDGYIYFEDLETGEKTRNPIKLGAPTKGTISLDPRGYPLLFVGQGLDPVGSETAYDNMYYRTVNLITGEVKQLWGFKTRDPYALRTNWQAYDSSALIDAETDTLIEPAENGILYTMKLNTKYDENAGTLTINPDPPVRYRYNSPRNQNTGIYGVENSAVAWRNYLIFTDNVGMLQCVDLNTMKLIYANDLTDDSDVSMVLEEDPAKNDFYLYTGCEYDDTVIGKTGKGPVYARKIDGLTGQIMWEAAYTADSTAIDGGFLASPVLGKAGSSIDGLIIYDATLLVEGGSKKSELIAFNKNDGKVAWTFDMECSGWSPSSPVPVYTSDGQCYIVQCDFNGDIYLLKADATSCTKAFNLNVADDAKKVNNNFEASPVIYENTIIVGSRDQNLFFIKIS